MNIKYTIVDFRKNMRQAFNEADSGRTVIIERFGQDYRLSALAPDKDGSYPSTQDTVEDDGRPIKPVIELKGQLEPKALPEPIVEPIDSGIDPGDIPYDTGVPSYSGETIKRTPNQQAKLDSYFKKRNVFKSGETFEELDAMP